MLRERIQASNYSFLDKLRSIDYLLILLIIAIGSISVIIEHGGSGSKAAAPLASKLIKRIIDRHKLREQFNNGNTSLA